MREEKKPESFAISKIYKGAYISSRGIVYEVTDIGRGEVIHLDPDTYSRIQQMVEVVSDIELPDYPSMTGLSIADVIRVLDDFAKTVQISRIKFAVAEITPSIEMFRCSQCGYHSPIRFFLNNRCPKCGGRPIQSPIAVLNVPASRFPNPQVVKPIRARICPQCKSTRKKNYLRLARGPGSSTAPLSNLRWQCECGYDEPVYAPRLYRLGFISEQYTQAITVSTVSISKEGPVLDHGGFLSDYVQSIVAIDVLDVISVTPGYRVGSSYALQATKRFPYTEILGRRFQTRGIKVELKPDAYDACLETAREVFRSDEDVFQEWLETEIQNPDFSREEQESRLKRWVLHSFVHALLSMISQKTDLEPAKFSGTYDLRNNFVVVYDNEYGGVGGVESLVDDAGALLDYLQLCRHVVESCDCRFQCPRCLYNVSCGEVNQALFRHLLGPIFDVDTFYV
ncbi:MAG: Zn-binding domain-containing protein [Candidatus Thorarchaeota archaeon]